MYLDLSTNINQISSIDIQVASFNSIRKGRGKPAWVAKWTRTDTSYRVGHIQQSTEDSDSTKTTKEINKIAEDEQNRGRIDEFFSGRRKGQRRGIWISHRKWVE
jgi:hypothetical protein